MVLTVSIHAPHAGRDPPEDNVFSIWIAMFQSTRPMRGATNAKSYPRIDKIVSIHAPHAGRDKKMCIRDRSYSVSGQLHVSIHAPHAGRDFWILLPKELRLSFNPRAPCGARPILSISKLLFMPFQSTRPMRGATYPLVQMPRLRLCFNPRAPCGARHTRGYWQRISLAEFQSTRPMRGATQ